MVHIINIHWFNMEPWFNSHYLIWGVIINHGSTWFHNIYIPPIPASHQAVPVGRSPWVARWFLDVFQFLKGKQHGTKHVDTCFFDMWVCLKIGYIPNETAI